jgi:hypothetical protein
MWRASLLIILVGGAVAGCYGQQAGQQTRWNPTAAGRPFYAKYEWSEIHRSADGSVTQELQTGAISRDSQGRLRIDRDANGDWVDIAKIYDAVQGLYWELVPSTKRVVVKARFSVLPKTSDPASGEYVGGDGQPFFDVPFPRPPGKPARSVGWAAVEGIQCEVFRAEHTGGYGMYYCISPYIDQAVQEQVISDSGDYYDSYRVYDIREVEQDAGLFATQDYLGASSWHLYPDHGDGYLPNIRVRRLKSGFSLDRFSDQK